MKDIIIIGGGVVGVCSGVVLARGGRGVALVERGDVGGETSFGNAGVLADCYVTVANNPDLWGKLPRILLGASPECRVSMLFALRRLPWLAGFLRRANAKDAASAADAIAGLLRLSLPLHKQLIREAGREDLLNERGWLKAFRSAKGFNASQTDIRLLERANINHRIVGGEEITMMEPALKPVFHKALYFPQSASLRDPGEVVAGYGGLLRAAGGEVLRAEASAICANTNGGWRIKIKNGADMTAHNIVVAAGPWSAQVLKSAGVNIPMAWERGYHLHYAPPEGEKLTRPVMDIERGYHIVSMRRGYRITTADEFADINAPPNLKQLRASEKSAREITTMGAALEQKAWLGRRPTLPDSVPMIGEVPGHKGLWCNFGHQHIGMSSSPGSALLLSALMNGEQPPVAAAPFSPARF